MSVFRLVESVYGCPKDARCPSETDSPNLAQSIHYYNAETPMEARDFKEFDRLAGLSAALDTFLSQHPS